MNINQLNRSAVLNRGMSNKTQAMPRRGSAKEEPNFGNQTNTAHTFRDQRGKQGKQRAELAELSKEFERYEYLNEMLSMCWQGLDSVESWLSEAQAATLSDAPTTWSSVLKRMHKLVQTLEWNGIYLLNGGLGVEGHTSGAGLRFISGDYTTRTSPPDGYAVSIFRKAQPASHRLAWPARTVRLNGGVLGVTVAEQRVVCPLYLSDDCATFIGRLAEHCRRLPLIIEADGHDGLLIKHAYAGQGFGFRLDSNLHRWLPQELSVTNGSDVEGSIDGEMATGLGNMLLGRSKSTLGLKILVSGTAADDQTCSKNEFYLDALAVNSAQYGNAQNNRAQSDTAGRVHLRNNVGRLDFVGRWAQVLINSAHPQCLANQIINVSGFNSLADIQAHHQYEYEDGLRLIESAMNEVLSMKHCIEGPFAEALQANWDSIYSRLEGWSKLSGSPDLAQWIRRLNEADNWRKMFLSQLNLQQDSVRQLLAG